MTDQENLLGIKPEDLGEPQEDIVEAVEVMSKLQSPDEKLQDAANLLLEAEKRHTQEIQTVVSSLEELIKNNAKNYDDILNTSKQSIDVLKKCSENLNRANEVVNDLYEPLDNDLTILEDKVINLTYYVWGLSAGLVITFLVALFK